MLEVCCLVPLFLLLPAAHLFWVSVQEALLSFGSKRHYRMPSPRLIEAVAEGVALSVTVTVTVYGDCADAPAAGVPASVMATEPSGFGVSLALIPAGKPVNV
jgi:hypothetical protein